MLSRSIVALALSAVLVTGLPSERLSSLFSRDEVEARSTLVGRSTPLGLANGVSDTGGALRFSVKYASSSRWGPSSVATTWSYPDVQTDPSALPLACPQPGFDSSSSTEDCLSIILYVPSSPAPSSSLPTLLWIHGGSFIVGSATAPGLDGSNLAVATNSIVAVVQYRLGALGFLGPDGTTNLAVNDIVNALQFLHTVVPSFGGSTSKITIAGQSSGANMVRALLAVPSASSLFSSGILQSDPMDYGFMSIEDQETLQSNFNGLIDCDATDTSCQNGLSVDSIIGAELTLFGNAINIVPAAGNFEPFRPVQDGLLITSPLDSTASFPSVTKPLLISTVNNEAAFAIYGAFPDPLDISLFEPITEATLGPDRTSTVIASPFYSQDGVTDARVLLQTLGTDSIWRCASDTFARAWVAHGGSAYVGQFTIGATYPGNEQVDICNEPGEVCHQDDIEIVFGTVSSPSAAQSTLITEIQSRYKAFLNNGNPNVVGYPTWAAATTSNVHSLLLGSLGEAPDGGEAPDNACVSTFWGDAVQFDYQVFDI